MATIVTRSGKGSPLTHAEVDANFTNLNTDKLELSGGTMTGNLSFGDNDKAIFGAGSDLQIYHTGATSIIKEAGTGDLLVQAQNFYVQNVAGTQSNIYSIDGGATGVGYAGAVKLATTSTGIDVTGTVTADGLTVDGLAEISASNTRINLYETDTTDKNTQLQSSNSRLMIKTLSDDGLTATERLRVDHSTGDISFYEDTGTTAKFFWDASTERLGIGNAAPATTLDVTGTVTADGLTVDGAVVFDSSAASANIVRIDGAVNQNTRLVFRENGTDKWNIGSDAAADFFNIYDSVNSTNRLTVENNGDISFYEDTGTTPKFFWDASAESLGIGTTSPSFPSGSGLSIYDSTIPRINFKNSTTGTTSTDGGEIFMSGNTMYIQNRENAGMSFTTNATTAMTINNSQNVGIGTSSPLSVANYTALTVQNNTYGGIVQVKDDTVDLRLQIQPDTAGRVGTHSNHPVRFDTNGSERMRIDSSGNLLVGTTDALPVQNNDANGIALRADGNAQFSRSGAATARFNRGTSDGEIVSFGKDGTTVGSIGTASTGFYINGNSATSGLEFATNTIVPSKNAARIDGALNLGMSTNRFKDLYLSGGVLNGSTTSQLYLQGGSSASNGSGILLNGGSHPFTPNTIVFRNGSSETMRIDSSGNTQIGTTTVNNTNTDVLTVGKSSSYYDANIVIRQFNNGTASNLFLYANNDTGAAYNRVASHTVNGTEHWRIGGIGGSAGQLPFSTSGSERMRIDSSGNLLVGKTSLDGTASRGIELRSDGLILASKSNSQPMSIDRNGTDGDILWLGKNGAKVGSIGVADSGDRIYLGGSGTNRGIAIDSSASVLIPSTNTGGLSDGLLGLGTPTARFANLYLSGGVYLGGTGAANKLTRIYEFTGTTDGSGSANLSYPTGFVKDDTHVISAKVLATNGVWRDGYGGDAPIVYLGSNVSLLASGYANRPYRIIIADIS